MTRTNYLSYYFSRLSYKTPKKLTTANYVSSAKHYTLEMDIKVESRDKANRI